MKRLSAVLLMIIVIAGCKQEDVEIGSEEDENQLDPYAVPARLTFSEGNEWNYKIEYLEHSFGDPNKSPVRICVKLDDVEDTESTTVYTFSHSKVNQDNEPFGVEQFFTYVESSEGLISDQGFYGNSPNEVLRIEGGNDTPYYDAKLLLSYPMEVGDKTWQSVLSDFNDQYVSQWVTYETLEIGGHQFDCIVLSEHYNGATTSWLHSKRWYSGVGLVKEENYAHEYIESKTLESWK